MSAEVVRDVRDPAPRTMPGRENYWVNPLSVAIVFTLFILYGAWVVIFGSAHDATGPYLSPFYSPTIHFGWWPLSAAFLVAWAPLGFRATCYYYRKAYYRAFFWDPPACAIREPALRRRYSGERRFPLVLNNLHRLFLYLALVVLGFLWWDTISAFWYRGTIYIGLGSVLMLLNVLFITFYTFSCHALRHFVGGSVNCFSCARAGKMRHGLWGVVTRLNPYHGNFAWFSLVSVVATDLYIRLAALHSCFGVHTGC